MISYEMLCTTRRLFSTNSFNTESFLLMNLDEGSFFMISVGFRCANDLTACITVSAKLHDNNTQI